MVEESWCWSLEDLGRLGLVFGFGLGSVWGRKIRAGVGIRIMWLKSGLGRVVVVVGISVEDGVGIRVVKTLDWNNGSAELELGFQLERVGVAVRIGVGKTWV